MQRVILQVDRVQRGQRRHLMSIKADVLDVHLAPLWREDVLDQSVHVVLLQSGSG